MQLVKIAAEAKEEDQVDCWSREGNVTERDMSLNSLAGLL